MQTDSHHFHCQKNRAKHHGDADKHDHARLSAQTDKTDRQHDDDRFNQRMDKFTDRFFHDCRLIGNLVQLHSCRHFPVNPLHGRLQAFAKFQDIAAILHCNRDSKGFLAVEIHFGSGWVRIAPGHGGNVPQPEDASPRLDRNISDAFNRFENAGYAQIYIVGAGFNPSRRPHRVLPLQGADHQQ